MSGGDKKWNGKHWIRDTTRLAIYLRDGMSCAYCGRTLEDGAKLSLDHLTPRSLGGDNRPGNLVTCCLECNSSRGSRTVRAFCRAVAAYLGVSPQKIERHVRATARRSMAGPRKEATEIMARRSA